MPWGLPRTNDTVAPEPPAGPRKAGSELRKAGGKGGCAARAPGARVRALPAASDGPDVLGLRPLVTADRGVLHALVVLQAAVAVGLDGRVMHEYIRRCVVGRDKAIALVRVEPLHCSLRHCALLLELPSGPTSVHPGLHGHPSL